MRTFPGTGSSPLWWAGLLQLLGTAFFCCVSCLTIYTYCSSLCSLETHFVFSLFGTTILRQERSVCPGLLFSRRNPSPLVTPGKRGFPDRSVKLPIQGTRPITPSNVPLCPFQYLRRLFLGRQRLRVTGTLCYTWLPGPPYSGRVKASSHPWRQQYPGAENTAGLCSQTRRPPLE